MKVQVDAKKDNCPIPVVKTKKAIQSMKEDGVLEVLVGNTIAVQNVEKLVKSMNMICESKQVSEEEYAITIQVVQAALENETVGQEYVACTPGKKKIVVAITSDQMGSGNDELGKALIKGFIFALTQLDQLPETMLFYNGGATITAEGSDSIEDLKNLSEAGVEIMTCGTCLDYYKLKDKLEVGTITNMYVIAEKLAGADLIIRP